MTLSRCASSVGYLQGLFMSTDRTHMRDQDFDLKFGVASLIFVI
jgi:hypothetical protein